jgi:hypothetical protein
MRKILSLIVFAALAAAVLAQNSAPVRLEIPAPAGSDPFNFVTAGKNGICIFYPTSSETGKDSISWSFRMVNDRLEDAWNRMVPLHEDVTFLKSISGKEAIYLLFHDTRRNLDGNIFVFMIVPKFKSITEHKTAIPDNAEVVDFEIANGWAYIGYNSRKGKPGISGFSLVNGEKRSYDITAEKDALLLDIAVDSLRHEVYASYKIQFSASKNHLYLNRYNSPGALLQTYDFDGQNEKRNFNSAQYIPLGDGKGMLAGTYGYNVSSNRRQYDYYDYYYNRYSYNYYSPYFMRQQNYDENQDKSPVSDGYYTATIAAGETTPVKYYNFSGFTNSYKYITDPSALRIKPKEKKNVNAEPVEQPAGGDDNDRTLNLHLLTHEILITNGQFVITSEAYSPEYHTNTQMSYDYYGRAFPTSYQVFDGFRYSHAFIAGFDSSGKMAWNNGMEMRDILTKYLNRKLNLVPDSSEIILFYNANNKIAFKTISGSAITENTEYTSLVPLRRTDQPVDEYLGTMQYWYSGYFIASGYQTIRNNYMENNKRNIFYLNKIAFQ